MVALMFTNWMFFFINQIIILTVAISFVLLLWHMKCKRTRKVETYTQHVEDMKRRTIKLAIEERILLEKIFREEIHKLPYQYNEITHSNIDKSLGCTEKNLCICYKESSGKDSDSSQVKLNSTLKSNENSRTKLKKVKEVNQHIQNLNAVSFGTEMKKEFFTKEVDCKTMILQNHSVWYSGDTDTDSNKNKKQITELNLNIYDNLNSTVLYNNSNETYNNEGNFSDTINTRIKQRNNLTMLKSIGHSLGDNNLTKEGNISLNVDLKPLYKKPLVKIVEKNSQSLIETHSLHVVHKQCDVQKSLAHYITYKPLNKGKLRKTLIKRIQTKRPMPKKLHLKASNMNLSKIHTNSFIARHNTNVIAFCSTILTKIHNSKSVVKLLFKISILGHNTKHIIDTKVNNAQNCCKMQLMQNETFTALPQKKYSLYTHSTPRSAAYKPEDNGTSDHLHSLDQEKSPMNHGDVALYDDFKSNDTCIMKTCIGLVNNCFVDHSDDYGPDNIQSNDQNESLILFTIQDGSNENIYQIDKIKEEHLYTPVDECYEVQTNLRSNNIPYFTEGHIPLIKHPNFQLEHAWVNFAYINKQFTAEKIEVPLSLKLSMPNILEELYEHHLDFSVSKTTLIFKDNKFGTTVESELCFINKPQITDLNNNKTCNIHSSHDEFNDQTKVMPRALRTVEVQNVNEEA